MTGHSPQIVELTEAMNAREHVLTALVDTYVAWQALRARQSGDREVGDRETALFSQRESLIAQLVAAEARYQAAEAAVP